MMLFAHPDLYVYGKNRKLVYRGRIDDNWEDSEKVTQQDLKVSVRKHTLPGQVITSRTNTLHGLLD